MMNLPESDFKFRRLFSWLLATLIIGMIAWIIYRVEDNATLGEIAIYLILLLWWVITYYMVAPSAEQIARIVGAARIQIGGSNEPDELGPDLHDQDFMDSDSPSGRP